MKTRITLDLHDVTVERDDPYTGERTSTTYFVPSTLNGSPGYVRIRDKAGRYPQVCDHLGSRGETLTATPETLLAVIRREHRLRVAAERRDLNRWS